MSEEIEIIDRVDNPPNPSRLIESLRDSGYSFNTAIADIVDNSIVAQAEKIEVTVTLDFEGKVSVHIIDNGHGMGKEELINAMKYGSEKQANPQSLSKFGLGLKTASTGFCKNLSVTSRNSENSDLNKACWDLDYIATKSNGHWTTLFLKVTDEDKKLLDKLASEASGTLVSWSKVDRLTKVYQKPGGSDHKKAVDKLINSLKKHLSLVFQRFLDPTDQRGRNISLTVNGGLIESYDPFCLKEKHTTLVAKGDQEIQVRPGIKTKIQIRAYVLPSAEEFSSNEASKLADIKTPKQGIYIYRENRMIFGPSWLKLFQVEPHLNLLRVEFSFDYLLDDAFKIDFMKSKVEINEAIFDFLQKFLGPPRRVADDKYRKRVSGAVQRNSGSAHDSSNKSIDDKSAQVNQADITNADRDKNQAQIKNKQGEFTIEIQVTDPATEGELRIQPIETIQDGFLWQPCIIDAKQGVQVNTGHAYYKKVYVPNYNSGVAVQGIDSLLWALSIAELSAYQPQVSSLFEELRLDVSRTLRKLVEDLPDPEIKEDED